MFNRKKCTEGSERKLRCELLEDRRMLAPVAVTTQLDVLDGNIGSIALLILNPGPDGKISLREAIGAANQDVTADTITFNPSLNGATIRLQYFNDDSGALNIGNHVTIDATMLPLGITLDALDTEIDPSTPGGQDGLRVFNLGGGETFSLNVTLAGLTIRGGNPILGGAGAIFYATESGMLTIRDCKIVDNFGYGGGAISATVSNGDGSATSGVHIERTEISHNKKLTNGVRSNKGAGLFVSVANGSIVLDELVIKSNTSTGNYGDGGGVFVEASSSTVDITDTLVTMNKVYGYESNGGGMVVSAGNGSTVLMDGLTITGNHADDDVGGLIIANGSRSSALPGSAVIVRNSTISGNTADHNFGGSPSYDAGGGVWLGAYDNGCTTTIENSTISGNSSTAHGGGIFIYHQTGTTATIRNTTISGNQAKGEGGGIKIVEEPDAGQVFIRNSTITANLSNSDHVGSEIGGGIDTQNSGTVVTLDHTIVAGNSRGLPSPSIASTRDDVAGPLFATWSLVGDNTGATIPDNVGNLIGTSASPRDPMLSPLGDHGGSTQTHAPLVGSPAIDAGNPAATPGSGGVPLYDQRGPGFPRKMDVPGVRDPNSRIEIGAHEVGLAKIVDVRLDNANWARDPYSFAEIVPTGKQLAPIYTQNVNTIQVVFSEPVQTSQLTAANIKLYGYATAQTPLPFAITAGPNSTTNMLTLSFASSLIADKYRLEISTAVTDSYSQPLDAEWMNLTASTPDKFSDDPAGRTFLSGNGTPGSTSNRFEFWFSVLRGDTNQDGVVKSNDANQGDVDGDGDHDGIDASLVTGILATPAIALPVSFRGGDYLDNELVGLEDYMVWRNSFGTTNPNADGNGDGIVDIADYTTWRDNLTTRSAWYLVTGSGAGGGSSIPIFDPLNVPRVANVTIKGSQSTHAPYSFDAHDGSGVQLRTVPVGGADTISITFTEDVNITADTLKLTGLRTANRPALAQFSYDVSTMTATWRFTGWVLADRFLVALSDAVTDVEGNRLDGEWVNPGSLSTVNALVSEFPSGNGTAGGNFNFVISLMAGDFDLDGDFDSADLQTALSHMGWSNALFIHGDANGNGVIEGVDLYTAATLGTSTLGPLAILADLNGDWVVNDLDKDILVNNYLANITNPTKAQGNLDGDSDIDLYDLDRMFAQFGMELSVVS